MIACFERISARDRGWRRAHPFDLAHGVQTSGRLPGYLLQPDDPFDAPTVAYIAAQPSIIRAALATVPQPERCHFFDLGCGKGRPLLVASEFSFAGLTGVELAPALAAIALSNAATFARAYPERRRITIVNGDATQLGYPAGSLAIFLYNPFGRPLVARVLANLAAAMQAAPREVYVIYYNPTWAELFDASPAFERRFAAHLPYDAGEAGFGPDASDTVVVWQNRGNPHPKPPGDASLPVTVTIPGWRAEIARQTEDAA